VQTENATATNFCNVNSLESHMHAVSSKIHLLSAVDCMQLPACILPRPPPPPAGTQ